MQQRVASEDDLAAGELMQVKVPAEVLADASIELKQLVRAVVPAR
jgi:hypothetical protein